MVEVMFEGDVLGSARTRFNLLRGGGWDGRGWDKREGGIVLEKINIYIGELRNLKRTNGPMEMCK